MFPTFDVPPQHAETVGARKARKAREDDTSRRSFSATSQSSGSTHSSKRQDAPSLSDSRSGGKTGFGGWFSKSSKKGIQEIAPLSTHKETQRQKEPALEPELELELDQGPAPPTAPLETQQQAPGRPPSQRSEQASRTLRPHHFLPPLPTPPPSIGLPPTPVSMNMSSGMLSPVSISDRKSQYSTISRASSNQSSVTHSNNSVFSGASGYETTLSEDAYDEPRSARAPFRSQPVSHTPYFEPVERGSRTGSRQSNERDQSVKVSQTPFTRALAKMESAGTRIMSARLSEEWDGLDDDESYQEIMFEKRLWALTAYQRLTQNKPLQSPAHELLSNSRPADQRRVLQIYGSLADGWMLANRYPSVTVYTLSSTKSHPATTYPAPLNHHSLYTPSLVSSAPFPDNYFDAVISRTAATVLRNDDWARSFFDYMRVLKPGGQLEMLSVGAHMSCEGPKLSSWVDEHISCKLEAHGVSMEASDTVLDTMEIVGLENIRRARIALPAHPPKAVAKVAPSASHTFGATIPPPSPQDTLDTTKMMAFLGRHFYQDLYSRFMNMDRGEEWFWSHKDLRDEIDRYKTKIVLTISIAQKPDSMCNGQSYLED